MIIKAIWLHNIRSYKDEIIVFPEEGITVIYGDIGSGKTSILGAIGFALFGNVPGAPSDPLARFANPTARDLLRRGVSRGFIRLWIKSGERNIIIHREIQGVGKTVQDRGGWVLVVSKTGKPQLKLLSATEMRSYIMDLLRLPEERTRARSRVFASAIYVPQFGTHSILTVSSSERSEIVNRVLNLYKYSLARSRIETLKSTIRRKIEKELRVRERELELEISKEHEIKRNIEKLKEKLLELKGKIENISKEIKSKNSKLKELEEKISKKQREISEIKAYSDRIKELTKTLEKLRKEVKGKIFAEVAKELENAKRELSKTLSEIKNLEELRNKISSEIRELQKSLDLKIKDKEDFLGELQLRKGKYNELVKRLKEIEDLEKRGICPVCKQPITHAHAVELKNSVRKQIAKIENEIEELSAKVNNLDKEIEELRKNISEKNNFLNEIVSKHSTLHEKYRKLNEEIVELTSLHEKTKKLEEITNELKTLQEKVSKKEHIMAEYHRLTEELEKLRKELDNLMEKHSSMNKEYGEVEGELKGLKQLLSQIDEKKKKLKEVREEISRYSKYLNFVSKYVLGIISEVEKYVKTRAFTAFREEFTKIFKMLMTGYENIDVEIKQDFSLSFKARVDGVLKPIETPSGGQLTCISLAYRLALNRVARSMIPQLGKGLLILDEPTYGFSPERVELLRRVLFSPGGPSQVIIVTHDRTFYEATGEEKLSIIKLELDPLTTTTKVYYENIDENYVRKVKEVFKELRKAVAELREKPALGEYAEFKPIVKTKVEAKERRVRKDLSLMEFIRKEQ